MERRAWAKQARALRFNDVLDGRAKRRCEQACNPVSLLPPARNPWTLQIVYVCAACGWSVKE